MSLVQIDWDPSPRVYRTFAWSLLATAAVLAGLVGWHLGHAAVGYGLAGLMGLSGLLAFWGPAALRRPLYVFYAGPAWVIGNVVSRVFVTLFFYLILTPMGLARRVFGRDPLSMKGAGSTWTAHPEPGRAEDYERPF
jgi:hypothetical protein